MPTKTASDESTETEQQFPLGNLKGVVGFRRVIQVRPYETAEAKVDLEVNVDLGADGTEVIAALNDAFFKAKAVVFDQLGLDFEVNEGGVVVELVRNAFGGGTLEGAPSPSSPPALTVVEDPSPSNSVASMIAGAPPHDPNTTDKAQKRANQDWARARYASHPDEFFDNSAKKASGEYSPKSPDLKHKSTGIGVWND